MFIYLISQDSNRGYDTYDSAVVIAENEEKAKNIHPGGWNTDWNENNYSWCSSVDEVSIKLLGVANNIDKTEAFVVCASFNAG